jgi:ABC-2 type transport system permease protein
MRRKNFLTLMQLSNWRWSWRAMLVTGTASPLLATLMLGTVGRSGGRLALGHVFTGALVMGLLFENQNKVAGNFAFMKEAGTLTHFKAMPVRRYLVVMATVTAFFVLSIPAFLCNLAFGAWFLEVPLHVSPWLIVTVPACAASLAGIGAVIGVAARSPEEASSITLLLSLGMLCLGPVMIPRQQLPDPMQQISIFSPATYASSALRQTLLGSVSPSLLLRDIMILMMTAFLSLLICGRYLSKAPDC